MSENKRILGEILATFLLESGRIEVDLGLDPEDESFFSLPEEIRVAVVLAGMPDALERLKINLEEENNA